MAHERIRADDVVAGMPATIYWLIRNGMTAWCTKCDHVTTSSAARDWHPGLNYPRCAICGTEKGMMPTGSFAASLPCPERDGRRDELIVPLREHRWVIDRKMRVYASPATVAVVERIVGERRHGHIVSGRLTVRDEATGKERRCDFVDHKAKTTRPYAIPRVKYDFNRVARGWRLIDCVSFDTPQHMIPRFDAWVLLGTRLLPTEMSLRKVYSLATSH